MALDLLYIMYLDLDSCLVIIECRQRVSSCEEKATEWVLVKISEIRQSKNGGRPGKLFTVTWKMGLT